MPNSLEKEFFRAAAEYLNTRYRLFNWNKDTWAIMGMMDWAYEMKLILSLLSDQVREKRSFLVQW